MAIDVKVPGVGESVQEGMIESWHKANGDWVCLDEILLELETDKATVEVASEAEGKLEILVEVGSVVKVGDIIAKIDTAAKQSSSTTETQSDSAQDKALEQKKTATEKLENGPAARRVLSENPDINPDDVPASGRGGRLTKEDLLTHMKTSNNKDKRIEAAKSNEKHTTAPLQSLENLNRQDTRKPMSMIRRRIAERLLSAQSNAALLTTFNEVDMTAILELRKRYKDDFLKTHNIKLGFMGFFLKASVAALEAFPLVNSYIEGTDIVFHNYCDIGVAVSTPKGLMVPVIRNVNKMTLAEIETSISEFAEKARNNKISMNDLQGGTFTVSNGGVFGSLLSTPIINPPQSAIMGMHKTQMRPVVMPDGSIKARPMMYLALSYDHRIIDGKEAVSFLVKIKDALEDPSRLLLGV